MGGLTVEQALEALRAEGLVVEDRPDECHHSLVILGGETASLEPLGDNEIRCYQGAFHVVIEGEEFVGRVAGPGQLTREERGDLEHVVKWLITVKRHDMKR